MSDVSQLIMTTESKDHSGIEVEVSLAIVRIQIA